jgi:hypothetical protein
LRVRTILFGVGEDQILCPSPVPLLCIIGSDSSYINLSKVYFGRKYKA